MNGLIDIYNNRRYYCWAGKLMLHRNWALQKNLLYGIFSNIFKFSVWKSKKYFGNPYAYIEISLGKHRN